MGWQGLASPSPHGTAGSGFNITPSPHWSHAGRRGHESPKGLHPTRWRCRGDRKKRKGEGQRTPSWGVLLPAQALCSCPGLRGWAPTPQAHRLLWCCWTRTNFTRLPPQSWGHQTWDLQGGAGAATSHSSAPCWHTGLGQETPGPPHTTKWRSPWAGRPAWGCPWDGGTGYTGGNIGAGWGWEPQGTED